MNKKIIITIFVVILLSFSLIGCQSKDEVVTKEFNKTSWKDDSTGTSLLFEENNLMVISGEIKPNMDPEDSKNIRYETNEYENIKIILNGKLIEISNDDGLIMEFEKLSDNEIKDSYGSIFVKKFDMN